MAWCRPHFIPHQPRNLLFNLLVSSSSLENTIFSVFFIFIPLGIIFVCVFQSGRFDALGPSVVHWLQDTLLFSHLQHHIWSSKRCLKSLSRKELGPLLVYQGFSSVTVYSSSSLPYIFFAALEVSETYDWDPWLTHDIWFVISNLWSAGTQGLFLCTVKYRVQPKGAVWDWLSSAMPVSKAQFHPLLKDGYKEMYCSGRKLPVQTGHLLTGDMVPETWTVSSLPEPTLSIFYSEKLVCYPQLRL